MSKKTKIIYDKAFAGWVLEALGKTTDKNGYVIDAKTKKFVLDVDGEKFKENKLICIANKKWITNHIQLLHFYFTFENNK